MSKIETLVEEMAAPLCEKENCYIYNVEFKKEGAAWCLRIYIDSDKEGGVSIDQCEAVSRALSDSLDGNDPINQAYELEVSSPGIERLLSRPFHFDKALGKKIEIKLYNPIDGKKRIEGILISHDEDTVTIENNKEKITIEKEKASQIKTVFEF
ncbi:MAG: ribosome maturation factor RimP [Bacillota bacterium]|nr:ribosome maturation factor RimP [Bacillota bacterium]